MRAHAAFFGDTHGNLRRMWDLADRLNGWGAQLRWIFQVGDFGVWPSLDRLDPPTRKHAAKHGYPLEAAMGDFPAVLSGDLPVPLPTYFIRGNHEDQEFLLDLQRPRRDYHLRHPIEIVPNLFYVPDGCIFELDGLTIAGWGGCWGTNTWEMGYWSKVRAQQNKSGWPRRLSHMTRDVFERLVRQRFDILVTHDIPTGTGIDNVPDPASGEIDPETLTSHLSDGLGVPQIRELIDTIQPRYHFSGHWHRFRQNRFGQTDSYVLDKVHPDEQDRRCLKIIRLE